MPKTKPDQKFDIQKAIVLLKEVFDRTLSVRAISLHCKAAMELKAKAKTDKDFTAPEWTKGVTKIDHMARGKYELTWKAIYHIAKIKQGHPKGLKNKKKEKP